MNFQIVGDQIFITNEYDLQTYTYNTNEMDETDTWNSFIHINDNRMLTNPLTCPYCYTNYSNKKDLINHLGFFNIDISTFFFTNISL